MKHLDEQELNQILTELKQALEAIYGDRLKGLYLFGSEVRDGLRRAAAPVISRLLVFP